MSMNKTLPIFAAALALISSAALAEGWTFEVYGGLTAKYAVDYSGTDYDMDSGNAFGFGAYSDGILPGFAVGVDAMGTRAQYTGGVGEYIESLSFMAVVRKDFEVSEGLEAYVAGGLGAIRNTYASRSTNYLDVVPGGQASVGLRSDIGGSKSVYGEIKHQVGFKDAVFYDGDTQGYQSTSLLLGLQFGF